MKVVLTSKAPQKTLAQKLRNSPYFHYLLHSNKSTPMQSSLRITPSTLKNLALILTLTMSISSCQTTKPVPIETHRHDTLYINKEQYDSIYITRTSDTDRTCDTITITKTMTEYRFRLLRDTIRIAKQDSIPYEIRIVETKEVKYTPPWVKTLAYIGSICILVLLIYIIRILRKFNVLNH